MFVHPFAVLNGVIHLPNDYKHSQSLTNCGWFISCQCVLTINDEYGRIRDGCPKLIRCVADIFALVLLQGIHSITECVECRWASVFRNLQLRVTAGVKLLSIFCPLETWVKKRGKKTWFWWCKGYIDEKKLNIICMPLLFITLHVKYIRTQINYQQIYTRCSTGIHKLEQCNCSIHFFLRNLIQFPKQLRHCWKIAQGLNDIYPLLRWELRLWESVLSCNTNM